MPALDGFVAVSELQSITDHVVASIPSASTTVKGIVEVDGTTTRSTSGVLAANLTSLLAGLPTADPHVIGSPWLNSHVLTVSAG